jgi:hypothetical protein
VSPLAIDYRLLLSYVSFTHWKHVSSRLTDWHHPPGGSSVGNVAGSTTSQARSSQKGARVARSGGRDVAALSRQLHTPPLPATRVPVGYGWQNNRLYHSFKAQQLHEQPRVAPRDVKPCTPIAPPRIPRPPVAWSSRQRFLVVLLHLGFATAQTIRRVKCWALSKVPSTLFLKVLNFACGLSLSPLDPVAPTIRTNKGSSWAYSLRSMHQFAADTAFNPTAKQASKCVAVFGLGRRDVTR